MVPNQATDQYPLGTPVLDYFKALNSIFTNHTKLFVLYYEVIEPTDLALNGLPPPKKTS